MPRPHRFAITLLALVTGLAVFAVTGARAAEGGPVSAQIGSVTFVPGGTVDLMGIFRADNTGSMVATAFGATPYENTVAGHLSEFRMSAQASRLSLKVMDTVGENKILGYFEGDFAGNDAANVFVNVNSHTFRLKHYWVDVRHGKWEVTGGQGWGWISPSKKGVAMDPANTFLTRDLDVSLQAGLAWTRSSQFRVAYTANDHVAAGIALENPEQYVASGEVIYPFAFNATLGPQFDAAKQSSTPNALPDLLAKAAWDGGDKAHPIHAEVVGIGRWFRATYLPILNNPMGLFDHAETSGKGAAVNLTLGLHKKLRLIANGVRGDGIGRYIGGLGPDVVVKPGNPANDITLSTVHAQSYLIGLESDLNPTNSLSAYYSRADFGRNAFTDWTSPLVTKPIIGFGGASSPNSANRVVHELTFGGAHTFWGSPEHGSFAVLAQFSEVYREPWFVAAGAPPRALVDMAYVDLRYTLP